MYFGIMIRLLFILCLLALAGCNAEHSLDDQQELESFIQHLRDRGLTADRLNTIKNAEEKAIEKLVKSVIEENLELKQRSQHLAFIRAISEKLKSTHPRLVLELISKQETYIQDLYETYIGAFENWLTNDELPAIREFILDRSMTWSGPAASMSEQLRVAWMRHMMGTGSLKEAMEQVDEVRVEPQAFMLCRSLYSLVYITPGINEYAEWLAPRIADPIYRDLAATTATGLFRQGGLEHAINWCRDLPDGSGRYNAFLKTFETCAIEKPAEGIAWFSSNDYPFKLKTRYLELSGQKLSEDIASRFVYGLIQNRETGMHPTEWIKKVVGPYRQVLINEGKAQLRRYDPQIPLNPGYQLQVEEH